MDVLHTNIVVVDGRRYRVQSDAGEARSDRRDDPDDTPVATEAPSVVRDAPPADASQSRADSGEWQERVSVDADLAKRALGGPSGAARLALERDTGARVVLPGETPGPGQDARSPVANRGEALVVGATADRAAAGRAVFESLVREALEARSTPHTHFVGVPLDADALVDAARAFRAECLARANSARSPPPMPEFAEPGRLRLAFFELKLCSDDARRAATRAMANAETAVETLLTRLERETGTRAVSFSLRGVDVDSDGRLVLEIDDRDDDARLASIGECFAAAFAEADVFVSSSFGNDAIEKEKGLNVELARWPTSRATGATAFETPNDAERVRRVFRDEARDFGRFEIKEVRLSKSREFDVALGGYFKCVQSVSLK
jgi:hypothetical protein